MPFRALLVAALVLALAAPVAGAAAPAAPQKPGAAKAGLKRFQSCSGLVRYARRNALRNARSLIIPQGEPLSGGGDDESGAGGGQREAISPAAPDDFSGTNVQEQGVDEPDVVKTDGTRLLVIEGDRLHSIDPRAATPALLDSLPLPEGYGHEILLRGDRALVISNVFGAEVEFAASPTGVTRLTEVDVSDPGRLRVINTLDADGSYLSARLTGETARVVIRSSPRALTSVRRVRRAQLGGWTPRAVLTRRASGGKRTSRLVPCRWVRRTRSFSGLDMVSVVTVDLDKGLPAVDTDALMTDADTVYASTGSLYIASHRWLDLVAFEDREPPDGMKTAIHRFDASQPGRTQYRSSGEVRGFLLSQWALSEHAGHLRVASTQSPDWWGGDEGESQSHVTVLSEQANRLAEVGRVSGLGRGERIYAVRFIGDVGYVVTFRETDPLYTVDLATPTAPRVLGELKILGYSAYLHPVGPDLLLGVGQDATAEGRRLGTQLSLFDVSVLRNPVRLHQRTLGEFSESTVEWDHRAFLYWPATNLTVLPVEDWDRNFFGAIGFSASGTTGITELGRVTHEADPDYEGVIRRTLVIGGRLFTVSDSGVKATPLDTLRGGAWLPFPT
jgi:uncharacterized secreted protein with C-terminal beta-propeller domain